MTATLATARRQALDEFADERLAERAEVEAAERDREEAEAAAAERRREQETELDELAEKRGAAVSKAETSCWAMVAALAEVLALSGDMAKLYAALGAGVPSGLTRPSALRHLSDCLSSVLRTVTGHPVRFGAIVLARTFRRPEQSWTEQVPNVNRAGINIEKGEPSNGSEGSQGSEGSEVEN